MARLRGTATWKAVPTPTDPPGRETCDETKVWQLPLWRWGWSLLRDRRVCQMGTQCTRMSMRRSKAEPPFPSSPTRRWQEPVAIARTDVIGLVFGFGRYEPAPVDDSAPLSSGRPGRPGILPPWGAGSLGKQGLLIAAPRLKPNTPLSSGAGTGRAGRRRRVLRNVRGSGRNVTPPS